MAVKRRRRSGYVTARNTMAIAKRVEQREEKKNLGQWWDFAGNPALNITTSVSLKGGAYPLVTRSGNQQSWLIYAMDLVLNLSLGQSSIAPVIGALQVVHARAGQTPLDFSRAGHQLARATERQSLARPRSYLPFTLVGNPADNPRAASVIPYRFFRGHQMRILPNEGLYLQLCLGAGTPNGTKVRLDVVGRCRFIEKPAPN